ncbi:MAG: GspMb/PilO family protein [Terriglobales bacterium]
MANLRNARRNITIAGIVLIVADLVAAFILISPVGAATAGPKEDEFRQLRAEVQQKIRTVVPPSQVQGRVEEARKQIAAFVQERMPVQSSALPVELGKLASDAGVQLSSARYSEQDSDVPGARQVKIGANIAGNYLQVVKFINSLERAKTFFVIDSISLNEEQAGGLRLALNLDAYLREQP